jgi:hypothetical protein
MACMKSSCCVPRKEQPCMGGMVKMPSGELI